MNDYVKEFVKSEDGVAVRTHGGQQIPVNCENGELKISEATKTPKKLVPKTKKFSSKSLSNRGRFSFSRRLS